MPQGPASLARRSSRRASSRIEIAVKIGPPVPPPWQTTARLVDVVEVDFRDQQLRLIHRCLLHDATAERIDDRAQADVATPVLVPNPIGGDNEYAIVERARLQRQVPDCNAIV